MNKVLVVDDSAVDRRLAGGLLQKNAQVAVSYASDGAEALRQLVLDAPDIVVTDLRMPDMSGLELVQAVRERRPGLPVILMTGQGSEDVAIQALLFGAASYVPKSRLAADLADTVEHVLSVARHEHHQERLLESCLTRSDLTFVLENDASLIPALVSHLQSTASRILAGDETDRMRIGIALEEALLNALYHGNLEVGSELREDDAETYYRLARERCIQRPYSERRIFVEASVTRREARFVVRDEGPGFDPASVPDPTDPSNLERVSGRGLFLIRTFMDRVEINGSGNEIRMVKSFPESPSNAGA